MFMYVACFFCLTLPLRKNLLGSKRKAINIYFALLKNMTTKICIHLIRIFFYIVID